MLISLKLRNFKSHKEAFYNFTPKSNILLGAMGTGKSTILQAISFALFGTFSELKSREVKLAEVLTRNSDAADSEIELAFMGPEGNELIVKRLIQQTKGTEASVRTSDGKLLAGPNATEVSSYMRGILKLDEDVFLRTIYAKQNEFDLFLRLSPNERKIKLDELMSLHKFEIARKNCVKILNKLSEKHTIKEDFVRNIDMQKLAHDIDTIDTSLAELRGELAGLSENIDNLIGMRESKQNILNDLRTAHDKYNALLAQRSVLDHNMKELAGSLESIDETLSQEIVTIKLRELAVEINNLKNTKLKHIEDMEKHQSSVRLLENQLGALDEKSRDLQMKLKQSLDLRRKLAELEKEGNLEVVNKKIKELSAVLESLNARRQSLKTEMGLIEKHLAELEKAEGMCPVCSTKLEKEQKAALIKQRQGRVSELKSNTESTVLDINATRNQIDWLEDIREQQKETLVKIGDYPDLQKKERDVAVLLSEVRGKRTVFLDSIKQATLRIKDFDAQLDKLATDMQLLNEQKKLFELKSKKDELASKIYALDDELRTLKTEPSQIKKTEGELQAVIREEQNALSKKQSISQLVEEKEKRREELAEKQTAVNNIISEIEVLSRNIEFLAQFRTALLTTQENLRKDLILAVNEVMSMTWLDLYPYGKFSAIRLDIQESDYVLQLKEGNDWINVAGFASGGERMLACLTLHIAFAKIMAPNLNILILDEPTHNLDTDAINKLIEVIQSKLADSLDQLFVVTHDEKLGEIEGNVIRL